MKKEEMNQEVIEETVEVVEATPRKSVFARVKEKAEDFGEKHPKIVKVGKGVAIGVGAVGCFMLGKHFSEVETEETEDMFELEELPVESEDFVDAPEEE